MLDPFEGRIKRPVVIPEDNNRPVLDISGGATQAKNKNVLLRGWIRRDTVVVTKFYNS